MSKFWPLAILTLLTFPLGAQTLPDNLFFEHVAVPGTIQSALTEDIFQDPYGMLWIGKDALYRYNGRDFRKYDMILPDSGLFSSREITKITWDDTKNRLLIGTRNYGVVTYDYQTDQLRRLPTRDGIPIVNDINVVDGWIMVTSYPSGFFHIRNDTLVQMHAFAEFRNPTKMVTAGHSTWVGVVNEVLEVRKNVLRKKISLANFNEYYPNTIRSGALMFDHRGHLWVGTERDGIIVIDTATQKPVKRFSPQEAPFFNSITSIVQDKDKLVWITTKGGGIVLYSAETDTYRQIHRTDTEEGSLTGENITTACVDASGIVWIGATGDLNKYDRNRIKFRHYYHDAKNPNSLTDDNIRNIYEDDQGVIYVTTSGGYLNSIDRNKNSIQNYRPNLKDSKGFLTPLSIAPFSNDILLVGSSEGLLQFDKRQKTFDWFAPMRNRTKGIPVRQIIKRGKEYVMTVGGDVVAYQSDTKEITTYDHQKTNMVSALAFDNQNRLWMGSREGVVYSDQQRKNFNMIRLEHDKDRPDSSFFMALSIQAIGNNLWVNSFNNAIYIIDLTLDPPRWTEKISTANGLPDNTVYASLPDNKGKIWISHNSGLSQYDAQSHKFIHFTVSEGLQDEEFNRLAYFKSPSGEIMFGGINGLNVFDPETIKLPEMNLSVRMVDVTSYQVRRSGQGDVHSLIRGNDQMHLTFDNNSLQFGFFIPDYHQPIRYRIRYKLEPFDASWIETDKLTTGTYSNLNPGTYDFTVRVSGPSGEEVSDTVTVIITPPYWKTWWFLTIAGVVCSFFVWSIIHSSVQSTRREKVRLEELLKIRTREIEQSREELENLNRKKDLIFSILSHDLRSPLTTLKGFLGLLIDNSDALSKEELQKYATNIRNSVTTSLDLIDNTLFWSLSQTGNIHCNPTPVQLSTVFEKIKGLYQLTAEKKHLTLNFPSTNGLAVFADENMVYVLLRNLVSNAIKFTPEMNTIRVDAFDNGEEVSVSVKDSGIGMTSEEINKLFMFDNPMVKKGTSSEKGTGLGLMLCKKFVEMNKGKLLIESQVGVGSVFTVVLPIARD
ncbi:MAG TPA: two-component regulator propeller domain-containing protein [Cyclobacteriaceae bacterium]|nr:two-component regulator propeller domain-containing protein [Cyclobacteriaceae bacterium]